MTRESIPPPIDPSEIKSDHERRKIFLRYVNRGWLIFGMVTLASLPFFPERRAEFIFLIAAIFPTYLIIRLINLSGRIKLAGVIFTLSVNFGFYGLFIFLVGQLGAYKAFETQTTVWLLMGLAVLFAGALVDKRAAPILAAINTILLIGTRLMIAPDSDPRPSAVVFWWMMALTVWLYESTLHEALRQSWDEVMAKKKAHEAIQEAELKYRMLVERLPVVIYTAELGENGIWHYVSPNIETLLGFKSDEWTTDPGLWYRLIHPDDRDRQVEMEKQSWIQQEKFEGEYRILTRDGRFIWVRDSAQILPPLNNGAPIVQGVLMEITENKIMEEALSESEKLLNEAQVIAGLGSYLLDFTTSMWTSSAILDKIFGIDDTYVRSVEGWGSLIHPEHQQQMVDYFTNEIMGKHVRFDREYKIVRKNDGVERWVHGLGELEVDARNNLLKMHGVIQDITERKQAELENTRLFEAERKQRQVSDALRDALSAGASMSISLDFETILDRLLEALGRVIPFEGGSIMLVQHEKQKIYMAKVHGYKKLDAQTLEIIKHVSFDISAVKNLRWILDNKQPMVISDIDQYPGWVHFPENNPIRSWAGAPIIINDEVIALFSLDSSESNFFTSEHIELMRAFTGQASLALQNARLFEETERRFKEFAALYETSNALSADNDLNTLLRDIVEHATTLLHAKTGAMYLYDQANESLEIVVSTTPVIPIGTTLHLGEGVAGRVAQTHQPMRIMDYSAWEGRSNKYEGIIFHAILEVPMLFGGKLIGVLNVAEMDDSYRAFTESDEHLLSLFAAQAAGALHAARLREETERRAREFASLYETSNALSSENELKAMLQVIVEHAKNLLGSASSGMYLYLPETGELEMTVDTTPYILFGTRLKLNEGVAGRVAQTRQPIRVDDYSTWEGRSPLYDGTPIRAVLEVPMLYGGELIGVLTADETGDSDRKFTEADERLLSLFASQAAGAIHSARLREQTARRLDQLQALHTIDSAISSSFDLRPILNTVITQTIVQLKVDAVDVLLFHPHLQTLEYVAGQGFHTRAIEQTRSRLGEGHAGRAVFERRTIHIQNLVDTASTFKRASLLAGENFVEYYGVPLIAKGEIKGVLEVFNRTPFSRNSEWLDFLETMAGEAAITIDQTQLFENLQRANFELITAYDATIEGWARAMDLRDKETENHTRRVTEVSITLATRLGIKDKDMLHLRRGALLHDIGKIGVPDNILLKKGKLTREEWKLMRQHPKFAYEMLQPITYLQQALAIPYCHHEKWDGTGYPRGLKGEQIPLVARIFAIACRCVGRHHKRTLLSQSMDKTKSAEISSRNKTENSLTLKLWMRFSK